MRRGQITFAIVVTATAILLGFLGNIAANTVQVAQRWMPWVWAAVVLLILISFATAIRPYRPDPPVDQALRNQRLRQTADLLAIAATNQWESEAAQRQLGDPYPISVRWKCAPSDLVVDWQTLVKLATSGPGWPHDSRNGWAAGPDDLAGADNDLVEALDRVPTKRMLILGERGAGKTILLVRLMLDQLKRRTAGGPVPVMLSLASWSSREEDLYHWIANRLITDYSDYVDLERPINPATKTRWTRWPRRRGVSTARELLDEGLIILLLDGFDEIAAPSQGAAIVQINDAIGAGQPLVLASRVDAYRHAVSPGDGTEVRLTGTAGVELLPLSAAVVSDYLRDSAGGPAAAARWAAVFAAFDQEPDPPPVAKALTTPLMTTLARLTYNILPGESEFRTSAPPTELLDRERFPTVTAVQHYLVDEAIRAAYRRDAQRRSRRARRWLTFLARDMNRRGTTDLAWWELYLAAPRALVALTVGIAAGLLGAVGFTYPLGHGFPADLGIGLTCGVFVGYLTERGFGRGPRRMSYGLAGGLIGGLIAAGLAATIFGLGAGNVNGAAFFAGGLAFGIASSIFGRFVPALAGALVAELSAAFSRHSSIAHYVGESRGIGSVVLNGLGLGLTAAFAIGIAGRLLPARRTRWSPPGLFLGLTVGLVIGIVVWIQAGMADGIMVGVASILVGGYAGARLFEVSATHISQPTAPLTTLRRDRLAFWRSGLGPGIAVGVGAGLSNAVSPAFGGGPTNGLTQGFVTGVTDLIAITLVGGFLQAAWGRYFVSRSWLALCGRLPWRLMHFFQDAHQRGILRQTGSVYQFRHRELQDRLASVRGKPTA